MKTVCKGLGPISEHNRLVKDIYLNGTKLNTTAMLSSDGKRGSNRRMVSIFRYFMEILGIFGPNFVRVLVVYQFCRLFDVLSDNLQLPIAIGLKKFLDP